MIMEAHIDISPDDLIAFNLFHYANSPTLRRQRLRLGFGLPMILVALWLLLVIASDEPAERARGLWPVLFLPLLYHVVFFRRLRKRIAKQVNKLLSEGENKNDLGKHTISISPEGLVSKGQFSEEKRSWQAIERIAETPDHAFFYVSSTSAIIIPKRTFSAEFGVDEFVARAREYHSATVRQP